MSFSITVVLSPGNSLSLMCLTKSGKCGSMGIDLSQTTNSVGASYACILILIGSTCCRGKTTSVVTGSRLSSAPTSREQNSYILPDFTVFQVKYVCQRASRLDHSIGDVSQGFVWTPEPGRQAVYASTEIRRRALLSERLQSVFLTEPRQSALP
jgi:hypothetical protein